MSVLRLIALTGLALSLNGCGWLKPHKIDVDQGNIIEQAAVEKLKPGMTRRQVLFVMGTPLVMDPFHQSRWDYLMLVQPGDGTPPRERHIILKFDGDVLAAIEGDTDASKHIEPVF